MAIAAVGSPLRLVSSQPRTEPCGRWWALPERATSRHGRGRKRILGGVLHVRALRGRKGPRSSELASPTTLVASALDRAGNFHEYFLGCIRYLVDDILQFTGIDQA